MEQAGRWLVAHRRWVLALVAALTVVAAAGSLRLRFDLDPRALVPGAEALPRTLVAVVALEGASGGPSQRDVERVAALGERARAIRGVARIESITHSPLPHVAPLADEPEPSDEGDDAQLEALLQLIEAAPDRFPQGLTSVAERTGGPLVVGPIGPDAEALRPLAPYLRGDLLGRSGRHALVLIHLDEDADAEAVAAALRAEDAQVTGLPLLEQDLVRALRGDPWTLLGLAALGNVLVLWFGFRGRAGVALPMLTAGATIAVVMGTWGWLGRPISLLDVIVPPLLLTVGVSDAVHLVHRYAHERERLDPPAAAARTFAVMARACMATSLTTAIGFASLLVADSAVLRSFAALATFGVVAAYLLTVLLVPAALPAFPTSGAGPAHPWLERLARWVPERRRAVFLGAALTLAASAVLAARVPTGTRLLEPFDEDHPQVRAARHLEREHGGLRRLRVDAPDAAEMTRWLRTQPEVLVVRGAADLLDALWERVGVGPRPPQVEGPLRALAAAAGAEIPEHLEVGLPDLRTDRLLQLVERIEARGGRARGEAWVTARGLEDLTAELVGGFALALGVIALTLSVVLGSWRLGLLSLLPNLLPLAMVLGWMGARGLPLDASTAMVFAVSLGLVVDGTIHLFLRFREERSAAPPTLAAQRMLTTSGRAVLLGGLTLLAGFAPILASHFAPLARFAELAVVAVVAATAAELLLTPALLAATGRRDS